ncbi:MAG: insulinase family protein [Deltaproteobacteria bacterium]|nr:insulinase family protein [Deltaproteobacteria bacterium]
MMSKQIIKFCTLIVLSFALVGPALAADPMVEELTQKKLPALEEPDYNIITLPNGVKVYYLQDTQLPIFKMTAYLKIGAIQEEKAERGFYSAFFSTWRSGGSQSLSADEVDEKLDFLSASIGASAGVDLSKFGIRCLMKDHKDLLALYFDILKNPGFDQKRIDVYKKQALASIKQRNEEAMDVAQREFAQRLYGEESPYAWKTTPETINAITRQKLLQFHKERVAPNVMMIAATSPLSFDDFLKTLEPHFKGWDSKAPVYEFPMLVKKEWQQSTEIIPKEVNQSALVIGHFGDKRFNKDKYKIILADEMLGGATFGTILGDRLRTELGYVYWVRSNFGLGQDYGSFKITTQTRSEVTVDAIQEIQKLFKSFVEEHDFDEHDLKLAKERLLNRLIFEYDSAFNLVAMRLTYDYYGYPPNYLAVFQKEIESVTVDQIKQVVGQYFFPDKLKIMIVGDVNKIPRLNELPGLKVGELDQE